MAMLTKAEPSDAPAVAEIDQNVETAQVKLGMLHPHFPFYL